MGRALHDHVHSWHEQLDLQLAGERIKEEVGHVEELAGRGRLVGCRAQRRHKLAGWLAQGSRAPPGGFGLLLRTRYACWIIGRCM